MFKQTIWPVPAPFNDYFNNFLRGFILLGSILKMHKMWGWVEILRHRAGLLCKSCQTILWLKQIDVSFKSRQKKLLRRFFLNNKSYQKHLWGQNHNDKPVRVRLIFSRCGSVKSWVPNFKLKTVTWSLRQEEW